MLKNTNRFIHPSYPTLSLLRIIGNSFFVVRYAVLLFNSVEMGIYFRLFGNILSFPFFYKIKMWDMMSIRSFFAIVEISKLIQIYFLSDKLI